jgi:hypothetical protein
MPLMHRLDQILGNNSYFTDANVSYSYLDRLHSDHKPMLLTEGSKNMKSKSPFRFLNFWTKREDFLQVMEQA